MGKLVGALSLVLLSSYVGMFILDPLNIWVFFYLKAFALGVVPGLVCFSWLVGRLRVALHDLIGCHNRHLPF